MSALASRVSPLRIFMPMALSLLGMLAAPSTASAQKKSRVVTISEVTIVGRVQKPIAAVDVSRIQPRLTLGEMRQPFLKRIEEAVRKEPF